MVGGALEEQRGSQLRDPFDALGFLVELQKLGRVENGFALVVGQWASPLPWILKTQAPQTGLSAISACPKNHIYLSWRPGGIREFRRIFTSFPTHDRDQQYGIFHAERPIFSVHSHHCFMFW